MNHDDYSDEYLSDILEHAGLIAVVGLSNNPTRASNGVFQQLLRHGYRAVGVNPGVAGGRIAGAPVYASLKDVPGPVGLVDVFRNSQDAGNAVDEALALDPLPRAIWLQLGVRNDAAAERAQAKGVKVVMDRCIKIEILRLGIDGRG
ncbi:MAG: CoA-binding domain protein [Hyphomicrobiales bacterium]|nr:CoA-binding domain protein [Hyphomicrobiales bacterium]